MNLLLCTKSELICKRGLLSFTFDEKLHFGKYKWNRKCFFTWKNCEIEKCFCKRKKLFHLQSKRWKCGCGWRGGVKKEYPLFLCHLDIAITCSCPIRCTSNAHTDRETHTKFSCQIQLYFHCLLCFCLLCHTNVYFSYDSHRQTGLSHTFSVTKCISLFIFFASLFLSYVLIEFCVNTQLE